MNKEQLIDRVEYLLKLATTRTWLAPQFTIKDAEILIRKAKREYRLANSKATP